MQGFICLFELRKPPRITHCVLNYLTFQYFCITFPALKKKILANSPMSTSYKLHVLG